MRLHTEQQFSKRKRCELNKSTDSLDMREHVRIRRVRTLEVFGERLSENELRKILRAAKRCQCGECFDCQVALECKRSGWK
jgi:hypothetical protein